MNSKHMVLRNQIDMFQEEIVPFKLIVTPKLSYQDNLNVGPFLEAMSKAWVHCMMSLHTWDKCTNFKRSQDNISSKMVECAVISRSNRLARDSKTGTSFHQFPLKDKPLLDEYVVLITRVSLPKLSQCHICSQTHDSDLQDFLL